MITKFTSDRVLTKEFTKQQDGIIVKKNPSFAQGTYKVLPVKSLEDLQEIIKSLKPNESLSHTLPKEKSGKICLKGFEDEGQGRISRTKDYFWYRQGPGVLMIDVDDGSTEKDVIERLGSLHEPFKTASYLYASSASNGINGKFGYHLYFLVEDAAIIQQAMGNLFKMAFVTGHGYHIISKGGAALARTFIDKSVYDNARLDFIAGPICKGFDAPQRDIKIIEKDSSRISLVKLLTEVEGYGEALQASRDKEKQKEKEVRKKVARARGMSYADYNAALETSTLGPDYVLPDGIGVKDILLEADRYFKAGGEGMEREICHPLEGGYEEKTKLYFNKDGTVTISSFKHGGQAWKLGQDAQQFLDLTDTSPDTNPSLSTLGTEAHPRCRSIRVIDAVMGTGKSSWAIEEIKKNPGYLFVVVVPLSSEVDRYGEALTAAGIDNFVAMGEEYQNVNRYRIQDFEDAILNSKSIITTHAMWDWWDESTYDLIESNGEFNLYLDETVNLVQEVAVKYEDFKDNYDQGRVEIERIRNVDMMHILTLTEKGEKYTEGSQKWFLKKVKTGKIFMLFEGEFDHSKQAVFSFVCPPENIKSFKNATLMTYNFKGSETSSWFDVFGLKYEHLSLIREGDIVSLVDYDNGDSDGRSFCSLMNICEDYKLNLIGKNKRKGAKIPLSSNWFEDKKNNGGVKQLSKNTSNFFRHKLKVEKDAILWTCTKRFIPRLRHRDFHTNREETWLAGNTRATNDYRKKTALALLTNIYPHVSVDRFFKYHGVPIDKDQFALSMMLQWIFRSAIRDGNEIQLYIPSERMRDLLKEWLGVEALLKIAA